MSYVIAVSNEKGGVAKTTTVLSLGAILAEVGRRVLLMDLDPQANLTLALGIERGAASVNSGHVLMGSASLKQAQVHTDIPGLDLVPSQGSVVKAEQHLSARSDDNLWLRRAFEAAMPLAHDLVILDCPPFLGAITTNALGASDLVIIPTQAEFFSAFALRGMMDLIRRVRQEGNPELGYRILVALLDRRNRVHRSIHEQLQATFGEGVLRTAIEVDTKLRESPIAGVPITQYWPEARGARQYRELAQELLEYVQQKDIQRA